MPANPMQAVPAWLSALQLSNSSYPKSGWMRSMSGFSYWILASHYIAFMLKDEFKVPVNPSNSALPAWWFFYKGISSYCKVLRLSAVEVASAWYLGRAE